MVILPGNSRIHVENNGEKHWLVITMVVVFFSCYQLLIGLNVGQTCVDVLYVLEFLMIWGRSERVVIVE